jgi:hypothetical protein
VRVASAGEVALLDEHGEEGVEEVEQWVDAVGGQAGDGAGAGGARQNQLMALRRIVHRAAKPRPKPRPIPHRSSPPGRPWPRGNVVFQVFQAFQTEFHLNVAKVDV